MKLAIISRRDSPNTQDLLRAAEKHGIACRVYPLGSLAFDAENVSEHDFFSHDVYIMRGYNRNVVLAQALARTLSQHGKVVVDDALVKGYIPTKFYEALAYKVHNLPHIKTYAAGNVAAWEVLNPAVNFPVVVKDVHSEKGKGVRLCHDEKTLLAEIEEYGFRIIVQEFVPLTFDIRVLCVGDQVLGAIKRSAPDADFRTNVSVGGVAEPYELSQEEVELALSAHKCMGYEISGVDIAHDTSGRPLIIETNITPEWQGFQQATGIDVADKVIEYIVEKEKHD